MRRWDQLHCECLLCASYCAVCFTHVISFHPHMRTAEKQTDGALGSTDTKARSGRGMGPQSQRQPCAPIPPNPWGAISGGSYGNFPWWWHPHQGAREHTPLNSPGWLRSLSRLLSGERKGLQWPTHTSSFPISSFEQGAKLPEITLLSYPWHIRTQQSPVLYTLGTKSSKTPNFHLNPMP